MNDGERPQQRSGMYAIALVKLQNSHVNTIHGVGG